MPRRKKQQECDFPYDSHAIIGIEDIYTVINYVQVTRKQCSFVAAASDASTMENLFTDCEIQFRRLPNSQGVKYSLTPPPVREISEESFVIDEIYADEIVEDGQCF